ncbi:carbohydrate ABC transporter permease [Paenibacillus whitsoniae]|uniref:Sugar ABC transporter permease n=1 Tax=Paenibacillus whitsoniae TaxID=2496558 RepID=A0A3S0IE10_9BACL|nr:sugar ABC transporter permease [Paenibacillus whitsoniae]RTE10885.1 sugar ABC transporter permease [Paenibacillus whitsoniae]
MGTIQKRYENSVGYTFILPWIIGFLAFTLIPMGCLIYFSFTKYDLLSAPKWIGLDNYLTIFKSDGKFLQSLKVTLIYVFIGTPLRLAVALAIAMLLNTKHRLIGVYRTVFYIPSIIGGSVAVAVMWGLLFSRTGAINSLIGVLFGRTPDISWVGDPSTALGSLVLLSMWQFGSSMVIFLAGLKNIPASYYEAAVMDGAGGFQRFIRVTMPMLSPVLFFNLIMQTIGGFMTFAQGLIITNGGPLDKTLFYQLYVYRQGFELFHMGYAAALSCILLVIVAILTSIIFKTSNSWVHYESKG